MIFKGNKCQFYVIRDGVCYLGSFFNRGPIYTIDETESLSEVSYRNGKGKAGSDSLNTEARVNSKELNSNLQFRKLKFDSSFWDQRMGFCKLEFSSSYCVR